MNKSIRNRLIQPHLSLLTLLVGGLCMILSGRCNAAARWTWIWGDVTHPPETYFFRQRFQLRRKPLSARLLITADDSYMAYVNEHKEPSAEGNDWTTVKEFDLTDLMKSGENLLAFQCKNNAGPGGLIYKLIVKESSTRTVTFFSDSRVRFSRNPPPLWKTFAVDDSKWQPSRELAPANGGTWGMLRGAPTLDLNRIVRLWNIRAAAPDADPYARPRPLGDRMLMSASVSSPTDMDILIGAGFTLFQSDSDHLSTEQVERNRWNWDNAAGAQNMTQSKGQDWSYFEHEAFPPRWYRDSVPFTRLQCLEHGLPVQAFSLWEPKWPAFIDQGYDALAKEFGGRVAAGAVPAHSEGRSPLLSAVVVGVHGEYGQVGLPTGARLVIPEQLQDWKKRFNDTHDHIGFWCNDPLARADFRAEMLKKYRTLSAVNAAWHTTYASFSDVGYPARPEEDPALAQHRQYLDFITWYEGSVGRAMETNLRAARNHFPDKLLLVNAGFDDEDVRNGADNSLIPRIAARYHAAVRSTHGAQKPFGENAATMLGRLGSACRFYGTPFWTEPPAGLTPNQTVQRIFESVSQGASGYFDWAENAVANRDVYYRNSKFLRVEKPIVDVAMFYPATAAKLRPGAAHNDTFARACAQLRDSTNFDVVDDRMIDDGCLANYRVLALWEGTVCEQSTLDKIKAWVDHGGVLLAYDFGKVKSVEGDTGWFKDLFGYVQSLTPTTVTERYTGNLPTQYRIKVAEMGVFDYLGGDWEPNSDIQDEVARRWTGASATIRLPVAPDKKYALSIRVAIPAEAADLKHEVFINGRKLGDLAVGDKRYRFLIPSNFLTGKSLAMLTFRSETFQPSKLDAASKDTRLLGVHVQSVTVTELGTTDLDDPLPPPGVIRNELDLTHLTATASEQSWARRFGDGLTIYFPANRSLIKGYLEVIRRAVYHLSAIDPERRDAIPVDDSADGIYATLFPDKILYYNPTDFVVTKKVTIPAKDFAAWKDVVATPTENSWTIELKPHSIGAIYLTPSTQELLFECEEFTELGNLKPVVAADCSPGTGPSCVPVPAGAMISTRIKVDTPGRYTIATRCLHRNGVEPVDILIDGQPAATGNTRVGQTIVSGTVTLTKGTHSLTLRARAGRDVRADFVLITNDLTVAGYDFAIRTVPVE